MIYDVVHTMYIYCVYIYCTPQWGETIYIYVCVSKSSQSTLIYYVVVFFGPTVIFLPITTKHVFRKTQSAAVKIQHNIL